MECQSAGHFQRPTGLLEAADATVVWLLEQRATSATPAPRDRAHMAKADENHGHMETLMIEPRASRETEQGARIPAEGGI